jgi:transposase
MRKKRRYSREVREEAVRQLTAGVSTTELARDLGVPETTLRYWRHRAGLPDTREQTALSHTDQVELKQLRRENEQLRATQDFLKKAIAFFARASESDTP